MNVEGRPAVKICGLRSLEGALGAARAGADLLGFNFAPVSRRRVAVDVAREAIDACRAAAGPGSGRGGKAPAMVGVFVNQPAAEVAEVARACRLEAVQLSGDEDAAACRRAAAETGLPVIKALRLGLPSGTPNGSPAALQEEALERAAQYAETGGVAVLLVDAPVAGAWGGTGQDWDWAQAAPLARRYPVLLAGGLKAGNVGAAVAAVRPWGVDVASGVETAGETDPAKVAEFVRRASAVMQPVKPQ